MLPGRRPVHNHTCMRLLGRWIDEVLVKQEWWSDDWTKAGMPMTWSDKRFSCAADSRHMSQCILKDVRSFSSGKTSNSRRFLWKFMTCH